MNSSFHHTFDSIQARLWGSAQFPSKGKSYEDAPLPRCFSGTDAGHAADADADADANADADADAGAADANHNNEWVFDKYFRFPIILSWSHWSGCQ